MVNQVLQLHHKGVQCPLDIPVLHRVSFFSVYFLIFILYFARESTNRYFFLQVLILRPPPHHHKEVECLLDIQPVILLSRPRQTIPCFHTNFISPLIETSFFQVLQKVLQLHNPPQKGRVHDLPQKGRHHHHQLLVHHDPQLVEPVVVAVAVVGPNLRQPLCLI